MHLKILALVALLVLSALIAIPYPTQRGVASPPPQGSWLTVTVNPDHSADVKASMYQAPANYTKNVNLTHYVYVYDFNITVLTDAVSPTLTYVGRNASVIWGGSFDKFNHTETLWGPPLSTPLTFKVYPNATVYGPKYMAKVRFNSTGTYYFNSTAITTLPHKASTFNRIIVLATEELLPANTYFNLNLSKKTSEVLMTQNFNSTLTPYQQATLFYPFNDTDSFSLTGTYLNGQNTGTLNLHMLSGIFLPLSNITLPFIMNRTKTVLTGTVGLTFNPAFSPIFTNKTTLQAFMKATLRNVTWINNTLTQPLKMATNGKVQLSYFNVTDTYQDNANAILTFKIVFKGDVMQFLIIGATPTAALGKIYNDTLALWTRTDYTVTYTKSSWLIVAQSTTHLVVGLDDQFNTIKKEFIKWMNLTNSNAVFLNSTIITVSNISFQQAFTPAYTWQQFSGLHILPPTINLAGGKFEEYGLFNYTGYLSTAVNFTLIGGSNGTKVVNIQIPLGVTPPNSASPTMDTWWNIKNFTKLAPIIFSLAIQTASAPTNLAAIAGNATVTLTYSPPASIGGGAITSYNIYRATTTGSEVFLSTATSTTFTDSGLINGQTYYYQVSAVNIGGVGLLTTEVAATPSAPLININENPFTLTTNSTILNWSYNATSGVATFQVSGNLGVGALMIAVPTSLVQSSNNVTITFDGTVVTPTITTVGSNYIFTLTPYHYTTHNVKIILALASATTSATTPFPWLIIGAVLTIIIVAGGGVYWYSKRKPKLKVPPATSTSTPPTPPPTKP